MSSDKNKAGRRKALDRHRILQTALELADAGGIKAISMRKLAQQLGVEAMSLYNHVTNKDEVIDGIVELVAEQIDVEPKARGWKAAMKKRLLSAHDVLSAHPWASSAWMSTGTFGPARIRFADSVLRGLREAGLPQHVIYHGFHVLQSHLLGYVLQEANFEFSPEELKELAQDFLSEIGDDQHPDLAEHIRQHMNPSKKRHNTFEFGLDLILDSLERELN